MPKYRISFLRGAKFISVASIAIAVGVLAVLAHDMEQTDSVSHYSGGNTPSTKLATSNKPGNEDAVKSYYMKTLGFQPMLPSYLPSGLKILQSTVKISDDTTNGHYVDFTVDVYNPSLFANKRADGSNKVVSSKSNKAIETPTEISIGEMPAALYNELQANPSQSNAKKLPPDANVHQTPAYLKSQIQRSTLTKGGLTITVNHMSLGGGNETVVGFSKSGVRYSVSAMNSTGTVGYSTAELIKVVESLDVPDKDRPTEISKNGYGTLTDAEKALTFKATVPTFVPEGFKVVENRSDAPMGGSDRRTGVPGFVPSKLSSGQTETGISSQESVQSHFSISYSKGPATINIHEDYMKPNKGGIIPPNAIPNAKLEEINGQKIYFGEENMPNRTGTNVSLIYAWKDPVNGVVYNVNGFNPIKQTVIGKTTLKKVVASMLK